MNLLNSDINNCITAIECHIIDIEEDLIHSNAGDEEWDKIQTYRDTLTNLKLLRSIYETH